MYFQKLSKSSALSSLPFVFVGGKVVGRGAAGICKKMGNWSDIELSEEFPNKKSCVLTSGICDFVDFAVNKNFSPSIINFRPQTHTQLFGTWIEVYYFLIQVLIFRADSQIISKCFIIFKVFFFIFIVFHFESRTDRCTLLFTFMLLHAFNINIYVVYMLWRLFSIYCGSIKKVSFDIFNMSISKLLNWKLIYLNFDSCAGGGLERFGRRPVFCEQNGS